MLVEANRSTGGCHRSALALVGIRSRALTLPDPPVGSAVPGRQDSALDGFSRTLGKPHDAAYAVSAVPPRSSVDTWQLACTLGQRFVALSVV
jgi:hypothetical protein